MKNAESQVESWWREQIRSLPDDTATAILVLCRAAFARISQAWAGLDPQNLARFHGTARSCSFALQIGLQSLNGELPPGEFPRTFVFSALPLISSQSADAVLLKAAEYSLVRDAYLTFKWGGYNVDSPAANVLRFRDVPAWNGMRDDAGRRISEQIEAEQVGAAISALTSAGWPSLDSQYRGPQTLAFPKVSLLVLLSPLSGTLEKHRLLPVLSKPFNARLDGRHSASTRTRRI